MKQITDAITRATSHLKNWTLQTLVSTTRGKEAVNKMHGDLPLAIIAALQDAGFAITTMGELPIPKLIAKEGQRPWEKQVRAEVFFPTGTAFATYLVHTERLQMPGYLDEHLPRHLAKSITYKIEEHLTVQFRDLLKQHEEALKSLVDQ